MVRAPGGGAPPGGGDEPWEPDGPMLVVRFSRHEVLRHKDFAAYTHAEFEEARRLMADLGLHGARRRSRRGRPSRKAEGRPDLRRTVRRSLRSGGEPIRRAFSEPGERPRRIVLICDVSGSMEPYSRALVRFLHAAVVGRGRIEAFALGTRLTRITRELSSRDPDAALAKAAQAVPDWSGGTRLGEGLRAFNARWGVAGARVVDMEGSGPRDPGAAMAVNEDGEVAGSVSGGCVEGAVLTEGLSVLRQGKPRLVSYGIADDDAFAVGLTCGGTIHIFI